MNEYVIKKYVDEIHTYPRDVQRVFNYMLQHPEVDGYNALYQASHGRLYNVSIYFGADDINIQYFCYQLNNRYGFSIPLTLPIIKTYLMFIMDDLPIQEAHFINNQWHLIKG